MADLIPRTSEEIDKQSTDSHSSTSTSGVLAHIVVTHNQLSGDLSESPSSIDKDKGTLQAEEGTATSRATDKMTPTAPSPSSQAAKESAAADKNDFDVAEGQSVLQDQLPHSTTPSPPAPFRFYCACYCFRSH